MKPRRRNASIQIQIRREGLRLVRRNGEDVVLNARGCEVLFPSEAVIEELRNPQEAQRDSR